MALFITIRVAPRSSKQRSVLEPSDVIKCFIKSRPEGGKANAELIKMLSKKLKIPQTCITITRGATSRIKRIKIDNDLSLEDLHTALGLEKQLKIV